MQVLIDIFWKVVLLWNEMALYLLFGFAAAGVLSRIMSAATVARHMGGASWWSITKAALLGIPLPLCSCGVIPTGLWLRDNGASRGATSAFLISTPQTGIDSLALTYSFLGWIFALFRAAAALFSGLFGGALVSSLTHSRPDPTEAKAPCPHCNPPQTPATEDTKSQQEPSLKTHIIEAARYGLVKIPKDIGIWLIVGIVAAGLAAWLIPDDYFKREYALHSNILIMLLMIAVGIPLYICSSASVPLAAVLISKGVGPGAVLVFLMAGPATNIGAIAILFRVLGIRATIIQTLSVMVSALICGLTLDWLYNLIYDGQGLAHLQEMVGPIADDPHAGHSPLSLLHVIASVILLLVTLNALRLLWLEKHAKASTCCHHN